MHGANQPARILWALDALTEDKSLHKKVVRVLRTLAKENGAVVEPVFVMSPDQMYVPGDLFVGLAPDMKKTSIEKLTKLLAAAKIPGLLAPTVLTADNFSLRNAIGHIVQYAKQTGAETIVATTSSRRGATRFLFGSFAETLVLNSDIPVFLVSPRTKVHKAFRHILFPTDLTEKSREVFRSAIAFAASHKAKLTLFHKIEYLTNYTYGTIQATPLYRGFMKEDIGRRKQIVNEMAQQARAAGVKTQVVVSTKLAPVTDCIAAYARHEDIDLVAMASQTGPVASALLGSVTRQMMRTASCPLWIMHPALAKATKLAPAGRRAVTALLALLFLFPMTALAVDTAKPAPQKWQAKMKALAGIVGELMPELVAKKSDNKIIERNAKKLSELSHGLGISSRHKETAAPEDMDPSIALIADRFSSDAKHAYGAIRRGQYEYGKHVLRSITGYCIACHSRHDRGPDFPTFPLSAKVDKLDRPERAALFAATRQFDKALLEYNAILDDDKMARGQQLEWERAARHALAIAVRVKKDPDAAEGTVMRVLTAPSTPDFAKKNAIQWKESLAKWKAEGTPKVNTEEGAYLETKRLFAEAVALQKYPTDRSADIVMLRASAAAHDLMRAAPSGAHVAEGLFIAGQTYETLNDPVLWPVHEMYYEACVRKVPHSSLGQQCYERYEEAIFVGYSGSGGTFIPDEIKLHMDELKALAAPAKKETKAK